MRLFALVAILVLTASAQSQTIRCKIVAITDGDTLILLTADHPQIKIRLEGIDAPKGGLDFSAKSKEALTAEVFSKQVTGTNTGKDRYDRTLGTIVVAGESVNLWMVAQGWAWHYCQDFSLSGMFCQPSRGRGWWGGSRAIQLHDIMCVLFRPVDHPSTVRTDLETALDGTANRHAAVGLHRSAP